MWRFRAVGYASLLLGACGTDGRVAPAERPAAGDASAWATRAEVAWLARVAAWNERFAGAGRAVGEFEAGARFEAALRGDAAAVREYGRVLAPIGGCGRSFAEAVGAAPTERLGGSERRFREAREHYRRGVAVMLLALEERD
ncbi:MAG TPA: hypothetical protein VK874_09360, partial [Gaiellaceae bacterium]|nr:hypothetical protein [Gaiellaceae bacterium]